MSEASRRSAFLIMPFKDELNWLHETIVESCLAERVDVLRADNIFEPGSILNQIWNQIDSADLVIAVCTGRNPNVFFELGYAWVKHQPILIAESMADMPSDVSAFRTELYSGETPSTDRASLGFRLRRAIRSLSNDDEIPRGRRLEKAPEGRKAARLRATLHDTGRSHRLVIANSGNVPLIVKEVIVPDEVEWFILRADGELPTEVRPGDSIKLTVVQVMGGGPSNFDLKVVGEDLSGERVEFLSKMSH
ncbi:hypothetical protein [Amycolatopsis sp. CA-126428]|uniref:hypothetical protein n=1 Tax=Amycolatopsis sp. CA-126428 TaxID=2073158 RepID=UPI0011B049E8|nr:hypothetical protein [Amycolatopsis sp. CA-126428]